MGLRKDLIRKIYPNTFFGDYEGDCLSTRHKTLPFEKDQKLADAWAFAKKGNEAGWKGAVPDIRWRVHIACWAASHGLKLQGDFVECGVHTGILSMAICKYLNFSQVPKRFYLFDTYDGIPLDCLSEEEKALGKVLNENVYFDCFELASKNFSDFDNAILVRGRVPDTFAQADIDQVAYLSLDMNNASSELAAIEYLWPNLVRGAVVVLDDYGWTGHQAQMKVLDDFASSKGHVIVHLPTGQGLLIKQ